MTVYMGNIYSLLLLQTLCLFFSSSTYSQPEPNFINLIVQYSQSDLPPLRPVYGEDRDSIPGRANLVAGTLTTRPPHLTKNTAPHLNPRTSPCVFVVSVCCSSTTCVVVSVLYSVLLLQNLVSS